MAQIPTTTLDVFPLCLGGNVFGWTADKNQSFAVLDAYAAAGGNFIDTADAYSAFVDGNSGGESETIIGQWMRARGNRDDVIVATKVGAFADRPGLSKQNITAAAEDSLRRMQTDHIDLYYAHRDDETVPQEETLAAFDSLVQSGKVRHIAASNFTADRLQSAIDIADREGFARYVALQPHYNLVERADFESTLLPVCKANELAVFPYFALAKGFLTGKYRSTGDGGSDDPRRRAGATAYLDARGERVLAALDEVAAQHGATPTAVSLAWLAAQPTVGAPIASARNLAQLADLIAAANLTLTEDQLAALTAASTTHQ